MNNLIGLNAPSILFICFHKLTKYNPSLLLVSKNFLLLFSIFDSSPNILTNPLTVSSSINYWYLFQFVRVYIIDFSISSLFLYNVQTMLVGVFLNASFSILGPWNSKFELVEVILFTSSCTCNKINKY